MSRRQFEFAGRIAVVTGAGSGIGRSTALLLGRLGSKVHAADLDPESAERTAGEIEAAGGGASAHAVDVTDSAAVAALADAVYAADGRVDVLHNNAGIGHGGPVETISLEDWKRVIDVNLMGVIHGVHAFVPRMLEQGGGGHIVNTASMLGLHPGPLIAPYTTSKHAVVGLSESLNAELSPRGIHVTALCPGIINTPITERAGYSGDMVAKRERVVGFYRRFGTNPDKVAEAAISAIRKRKLIAPVPRHHVLPTWWLRRISPRAAQPLGRLSARVMAGKR